MKRLWIVLFVMLAVALVPAAYSQKGDAAAGKTLFGAKCATCHGAAGEGKDAIAKMMKVEIKHLGSKEVQARSDADLKKVVADGTGKMKAVKLTDAETANLIAFLRTLKK
ncbi:MAG: cytochrome c [Acidobacteria bacterium]|nr:cytochrome c [Acidobacteriota bacterium]